MSVVALAAAGVYAGATAYIGLVEHPARLACAPEVAWAQWTASLGRTPRYAASALVGAVAGLVRGRAGLDSPWTWGSILLLAVVPWTVSTMLPIQRRLSTSSASAPADTRTGLQAWGRRHAVRASFGAVAFVLFLWASSRTA